MINISTLENSLIIFDNIGSSIQQVNKSLSFTKNITKNFVNYINIDMSAINSNFNTYVESLNVLSGAQDKAAKGQKNVNDSVEKSSNPIKKLLGEVKGLISGFLGFDNLKAGMKLSIEGAAKAEQDLFNIQTAMGNKEVGKAYFDNLKKHANSSAFAFDDFANNARNFMEITKNTNSLDKLGNLSERLTLRNPNQGLQGSGDSLKEAMSGNFSSLKENFGFNEVDAEILKASKSTEDFIGKFDILLNKKGLTEERLAEYNRLPMPQMDQLKENYSSSLAEIGQAGLQALTPLMIRLNEAFSSNSLQRFIIIMSAGLSTIINLGVGVADIFMKIASLVVDNLDIIAPIILGIAAAMIVYNATMGIAWLTTMKDIAVKVWRTVVSWAETAAIFALIVAQDGLNAALAACPITWIIIAIIILITLFYAAVAAVNHFAGTSLSATGMIVGAIAFVGAFIWNTIIGVINAVIQYLWTRFVEPFIGIIEWVLNVANGGFNSFGDAVANLIGQIISWFLSLGKIVTKIIDAIFGTNWTSALSSLQDSVLEWGKNDKAITLDRTAPTIDARVDYGDAYNSGYNFGKNLEDKFSFKMPKMPDPSSLIKDQNNLLKDWNTQQADNFNMGNDKLDKVNDNIGISNENLQFLRDLAEQESIQNFVTLTPTVQVTTGDIKEEADINKIITKIENYMQNELAIQAEGVYA